MQVWEQRTPPKHYELMLHSDGLRLNRSLSWAAPPRPANRKKRRPRKKKSTAKNQLLEPDCRGASGSQIALVLVGDQPQPREASLFGCSQSREALSDPGRIFDNRGETRRKVSNRGCRLTAACEVPQKEFRTAPTNPRSHQGSQVLPLRPDSPPQHQHRTTHHNLIIIIAS